MCYKLKLKNLSLTASSKLKNISTTELFQLQTEVIREINLNKERQVLINETIRLKYKKIINQIIFDYQTNPKDFLNNNYCYILERTCLIKVKLESYTTTILKQIIIKTELEFINQKQTKHLNLKYSKVYFNDENNFENSEFVLGNCYGF